MVPENGMHLTGYSLIALISFPGWLNTVPKTAHGWQPGGHGIGMRFGYCKLEHHGGPIDSALVYTYHDGYYKINYKNCTEKSMYDPFSDTRFSYSICDADGTFELRLKNKEGKEIVITEGEFVLYKFEVQ